MLKVIIRQEVIEVKLLYCIINEMLFLSSRIGECMKCLLKIFGILTIGLILWKGNGRINTYILKACNLKVFMQVIGLMAIYLIIISSINGLYYPADLFINRLRCVNQLVVLTLIQLASIYFIALISIKYNLELKDIINILIKVGIVQGV